MTGFPVAAEWFRKRDLGGGLTLIDEPHTDVLMRANIWHLRGRDRDLLVDGGLGVAPLRPAFPELFEGRETIAFATHTHADHIGAIHEFEQRWVHPLEAEVAGPAAARHADLRPDSGRGAAALPGRGLPAARAGPGHRRCRMPATICAATPCRAPSRPGGSRRGRWSISATGSSGCCMCPAIRPAASPCSRTPPARLFAGDVIYDGPLLYRGPGMDIGDYVRSFALLRSLPLTVVHAGHDDSFGKARLDAIIDVYLARWRAEGLIEELTGTAAAIPRLSRGSKRGMHDGPVGASARDHPAQPGPAAGLPRRDCRVGPGHRAGPVRALVVRPAGPARHLAKSWPRSAKALNSSALPDGSRKNIVACSPTWPLKRT